MKNRSQPFDCSIAAKAVGITLRHGGGLQEPSGVYVRCDERDCQYVDLNVAPCPLRVDMFADGSDRKIAEHLAGAPGWRFCYACLTESLGVTHEQVRRASWRLRDVAGFAIKPSRCVECRRRRVTIGITPEGADEIVAFTSISVDANGGPTPASPGAMNVLEAFVRAHAGFAFCAHCLARELKWTPAACRDAIWSLEPQPGFHVRTAQCVSCLFTKRVIRYAEPTHELNGPRRVIELLLKTPGDPLCASCVAFATDVALPDARQILRDLEALTAFEHHTAACTACGRWQAVTSVRTGDVPDSERAADLGDMLAGHVRYGRFRIDLMSFRAADGWRPFALVKTAAGALVPDAPALLFGVMPTKVEADEVAVTQARDWIDKRFQ